MQELSRLCRVTFYCLVTIFVMNGGLQEFTNMFNTKHGMSCVICHCQLLVFIFVIVSMTGQCIVMVICSQQCLVLCIPFVFNLLYTKLGLGNCWPKSEGVWNNFLQLYSVDKHGRVCDISPLFDPVIIAQCLKVAWIKSAGAFSHYYDIPFSFRNLLCYI